MGVLKVFDQTFLKKFAGLVGTESLPRTGEIIRHDCSYPYLCLPYKNKILVAENKAPFRSFSTITYVDTLIGELLSNLVSLNIILVLSS